jgi:DNA-binding Lrp family transcriptional regulator
MQRKPRFQREPDLSELQLTERDRNILRHVARHRFLNSRQILTLVGGSTQHVLKRLQRLFHHGYLDRPRAQIRYYSEEGSRPLAYAIGSKSAKAFGASALISRRNDNRNVKQLYLDHTLQVADVVLAFESACVDSSAPRIYHKDEVQLDAVSDVSGQWSVNVRWGNESKRVGVIPDGLFLLESPTTGERVIFCVEADRATMPVTRHSLRQSSVLRKLLAYEATWTQDMMRQRFGCARFRVLIVTSSADRVTHVIEAAKELSHGRGLFLCTDVSTLAAYSNPTGEKDFFDLPWRNLRGEIERIELR